MTTFGPLCILLVRRKHYNRSAFSADIIECAGKRGDDFHQNCYECINENPGYRCKCRSGFREDNSNNEDNCIDINECEVGEEGYDSDCHNCNNTKGSHTCSCNRGYKLSSNGKWCIGQ
ncbi:hypothetical protein CAPTEDRAFT_217369 [Capitella teleta]|uniref:EGF-like domain-containing protein n=1 Tax=Capitella teleta TaxID=283909 RepID=R7VD73_CAPTE|nr:hypothetical protein CAPTEDRAFT_217369 [Capitella teleta]|eukprot:ELU16589.1 hypothetical protein CAPTEDRAFT_217369 [Capitella teleta]